MITILKDNEILDLGLHHNVSGPYSFARAIEQAVLQSPEMQQRMEAHASAKVQEILHEEAKPDNIKRAEYYGEGYADGWKSALEKAARLVDGCHPKATRKGIATAIRALMPR